ncbi:ABC transporter substrate-binding protein [Paracoccus sp. SCSIO 75233]|uniref:ABC transporter substrate-binding protein n=1 Tax=Paracoccus sp. SCSIO 75233 TaxID=3017782 RepID=UPI0022F0A323|nr:ABC transporter substrate-binding protein [Paracoccus sp. SCSIO 75233]WBU53223.1 ABC transporter substrate-binding protein [Paracoccus sp. SCSIO 75233]
MRNAIAAGLIAFAAPAAAETTVGLLLPASGNYAALGQDIEDGFRMAITEAARDDIRILREDTEAKPQAGLTRARKLIMQDQADVLVGVVSSAVLGAVRDVVHQAQVPLIVANAGNSDATGKDCSPYITRVSFSNDQLNRPMGEWMAAQRIGSVFTLAPDYAAGQQMIGAFSEAFTAGGGEVVGGDFTPFGKTEDFGPYLAKAQASGAEALYVFYGGADAISFVKQYDSFGLREKLPLYSVGFLTAPLYLRAQGEAAEGVIGALHYLPSLDTAENDSFVESYALEHDGNLPSEYVVAGYDAGRLLLGALETGAEGRAELAAALPKVAYTGPRGPLEIDPATNNIVQNVYVFETVSRDGEMTHQLLDTVEAVRDAPNGCEMG